ncbi:winged helix family transcriptional regulator [Spirosoma pollinicola]|uniref:Winged helix family transcriptional regulator n=1 Tax=Spirosoma pollinicola TaxID=2057025 RepID=A0A2K8ZBH7_9BACT|nr:winged helix family transcriptional regulator [Spirosoma pollinicola]
MRLLIISGIVLITGLLFTQFVGLSAATDNLYSTQKVNLALRRTAHHLLRAAGDSTSRIPAVQQLDPHTFRLQLATNFDYDRLPGLLRESFRLHNVMATYDVAVLDCARGEVQLGYSVKDLLRNESIPCVNRSLAAGCYTLQITFNSPAPSAKRVPFLPLLGIGGLLVGLLFAVRHRKEHTNSTVEQPIASIPASSLIRFGRSSLDLPNLTLITNTTPHSLTYREAKLLRLLVSHPNQILERDQILKLVWEDEGITVGRSVDVFVSRLRKLLQDDPTIKIAAVHGVGYRLEIQNIVSQ